jgi:hypothetical protein
MVVSENRDSRAGFHFRVEQPRRNRFRHAAKFGITVAFDSIRPLDFDGDILRPTLGAFHEAVVEGGHVRNGILHYNRPFATDEADFDVLLVNAQHRSWIGIWTDQVTIFPFSAAQRPNE